jgi:predicted permease
MHMKTVVTDLRVGLRHLWRDKVFTATAVLTLAVCIGANAALFSVVRGVLLKPLAMPDADRVVIAGNMYPGAGVHEPIGAAVPDYFDRLRDVTVFAEQALLRRDDRSVDEGGTPVRVEAMTVTPSFFRVAGVKPQVGRTFNEQESELGNEFVVVLSDSFWRSRFAGEPSAVGRELRLDGRAYTVVGVMPPRFRPTDDDVELWTPMTFTAEQTSDNSRHSNNAAYIARLKPGATLQQAQAQIDALNAANLDRFPQFKDVIVNAGFRTVVNRLQDQMVKDVRATLYLMWGGSLFVLLIGCVNIANLALVRTRSRLKELATRLALGAGRWQIARQLAVEHLLLAAAAAIAGIAIGNGALLSMNAISLQELPRAEDIALDRVVVMYTLAAAVVIGLLLGLIPVAATISANVIGVLREEGRSATTGRSTQSFRRALVVAQVASAFVLLVGAGLLLASFQKVLAVDPGFRTGAVSRVPCRSPSRDMTVPTRGGASPTKRCDACGCCQACRQPARPTAFRLATARVRQRFSRRATQGNPANRCSRRLRSACRRAISKPSVRDSSLDDSSTSVMPRRVHASSWSTIAWPGAFGRIRILSAGGCIDRATMEITRRRSQERRSS